MVKLGLGWLNIQITAHCSCASRATWVATGSSTALRATRQMRLDVSHHHDHDDTYMMTTVVLMMMWGSNSKPKWRNRSLMGEGDGWWLIRFLTLRAFYHWWRRPHPHPCCQCCLSLSGCDSGGDDHHISVIIVIAIFIVWPWRPSEKHVGPNMVCRQSCYSRTERQTESEFAKGPFHLMNNIMLWYFHLMNNIMFSYILVIML